jgi:precorrin-2/cobalt-factor-2 C20-methyltransferase
VATFFAVGVGPGDPELITRKAERILRSAATVCAPVTRPGEKSFALEIVRDLLDTERQEILEQHFPMTADRSELEPRWQEAARQVAERIEAGRDVAFIAIGDPLIYATSIYLISALRRHHPQVLIEVVPGISSINATAAVACFPLADGTDRIAILPATSGIDRIAHALAHFETVILLKVKPHFGEILELIDRTGNREGILFAERVGMAGQVLLTDFSALSHHSPDYLSLMIVRRACLPHSLPSQI